MPRALAVNIRRTDRAARARVSALALLTVAALFFQPATSRAQSTAAPAETIQAAANEGALWLARLAGPRTTLFQRSALGPLRATHTLNGRIALMAAVDDELLIVLEDNSIFRYSTDEPAPARELDLPGRERPLQLLANGRKIYALLPSTLARRLDAPDGTATAPSTRPFDPGEAPLSIATYDGRRWSALAACPTVAESAASGPLQPRLCLAQGDLLLLWATPAQVHFVRLDPERGAWRDSGTVGAPGLTGFWICVVGSVPTLLTTGETVAAYRLLPDGAGTTWRRGELHWSPLPDQRTATRVESAFGFNQHVGLLVRLNDGESCLQFGRFGEPPSETTARLGESLSPQRDALPFEAPLQVLMLLAVMAVFTTLVLFRRASITRPVALPPGVALAYTTQRLVAWLIDFLPFMLIAAAVVDVNWLEALGHVFGWAVNAQAESTLPAPERLRVMSWWGLSAGGYVIYCLVMELVTGRTVGKLLLGVRLLSETGQRVRPTQILIRNGSRLLELLPPLWVLGFLALLTRNRQRVGDIFARTVAVRRTSADKPDEKPRETPPPDRRDNS